MIKSQVIEKRKEVATLNLKRFGERVRTSRTAEERNWTLEELAVECTRRGEPVSANYLSTIERSKTHPDSNKASKPREGLVDVLIELLDLPQEARLEAGYPPKELLTPNVRLALRLEPYLTHLSAAERERAETFLEQTARNLASLYVPAA
jgi:transcriptional regulator with XRE-family HTH domain